MTLVLALLSPALAATFTAEDLVRADARGLPGETATRMAETVGTESATAVYLLRRGVSADTLATWGYTVGEAERAEADQLGTLTAPAEGVSDADWSEMAELPTWIERTEGKPVSGSVLVVVPELAVVRARGASVLVERSEARDVWVDARPLTAEVFDAPDERLDLRPHRSSRVAHARRGGVGTGVGALLLATGGASLLAGGGVVGLSPNVSWASLRGNYGIDVYPSSGNTVLFVAGAVGLLAGGVTLHFGARELRLAGAYPGGWTPTSDAP